MSAIDPSIWHRLLIDDAGSHYLDRQSTRGTYDMQMADEVHWGRSESLDPDNVGDIADEGLGHRG